MSNKKLTRFYVLSQNVYDSLKKSAIDEKSLNLFDKSILEILQNKHLSPSEKFLNYSQKLSRQLKKIRDGGKTFASKDRNAVKTFTAKDLDNKSKKNVVEKNIQTDFPEIVQPIKTKKITEQATQTELSEEELGGDGKIINNISTDEDEEYDKNFHSQRLSSLFEPQKNNFSIDEELFGRPFDFQHKEKKPPTQPLRRSKRILMREMPEEFDEDTAAAALEFAQEEFGDPQDRNYITRPSIDPTLKIIEHKPTGDTLSVSLDDVVDVVDTASLEEKKQNRKRKKETPRNVIKQKSRKVNSNQKGGSKTFAWEKY